MSKCTNPELGNLLHAYELRTLSEEDTKRFEIHMLECEYCFNEVKNFEQEADLLTSDEEVKELIQQNPITDILKQLRSFLTKLWGHLWPEKSLVFKPAFAYLLVLLMIVPTYHWLRESTDTKVKEIQRINLYLDRSNGDTIFKINAESDGLIEFGFENAVVGKSYSVIIESQDSSVIYENNAFTGFNEYGIGYLSLHLSKIQPGSYRLVITDPLGKPPLNQQEYRFRVEK